MRIRLVGSLLAALAACAAPALAHHISGTVYCDQDGDGAIDTPGDTPVVGVIATATSLDVSPGQQFSDGTNPSGFYSIGLPARTDRYRVTLSGLQPGWSVVLPPGAAHVIQIVTGTPQDHADGVDFLVQGCGAATTTTSTTTTTTTTTTQPPQSTTTTTPTTTTTTTTVVTCDCPATPFLVAREAKLNNDATIAANVGANNIGGRLRLGKGVTMPDGTRATGDLVIVGNGSSVWQVFANTLQLGSEAVVRNGTGTAALPIALPFCPVSIPPCGTDDIQVSPNQTFGPLAPGTYGRLRVLNGATITLTAGEFTFCDVKMGRNASIIAQGPVSMNVVNNFAIGTASRVIPASGTTPVRVNAGGKSLRVSQSGLANVAFFAPAARISFGRDAHLVGCFCTDRAKSDKHITLECPAP